MAEQLFYLTENDRDLLRDFVERELRGRNHSRSRYGIEGENSQSPDVYVVRTPSAGIPALDVGSTTGSGSLEDDTPGSAECDVYRLVQTGGTYDLKPTGVTRRIYNLDSVAASGNTWTLVARDKFGTWYTVFRQASAAGAFSGAAIYYAGTVQAASYPGASSFVELTFDTEEFDVGGYHDVGTPNSLHAIQSGYHIVGSYLDLFYDSGVGGEADGEAKLVIYRINSPAGRLVNQDIKRGRAGQALETYTTVSTMLHLTAGDELRTYFDYTHGGTHAYGAVFSAKRFWITKIG